MFMAVTPKKKVAMADLGEKPRRIKRGIPMRLEPPSSVPNMPAKTPVTIIIIELGTPMISA
jgi:hypothetical protein